MRKCPNCGFPLDPWGDCIRCVKPSERELAKHEQMKIMVMRELRNKTPQQVAHEMKKRFPAVSIEVAQRLEREVKKR